MKKIMLTSAAMFFFSTPAFALFVNGGFESGDFTGWTIDTGRRTGTTINWAPSGYGSSGIWDASSTMLGQTTDIDPFNGSYMARINDSTGGYDATKISQTDTISQQDLDDGGQIFVNWGAALIEPSNTHPEDDQPFFGINVLANGSIVETFNANALNHNIDPTWSAIGSYGGSIWYKQETWSYDLSSFAVGTAIGIEMFVADCDWGGHGGYAFLDGIGTVDPGSTAVPEPSTMLLMGAGLLGLFGYNRKRFGKKS